MDLDQDGNVDLLSGSWPGELFFFARQPDLSWAAPEMLKHADGEFICIGGGLKETPEQLLITGHGEFVQEGTAIVVQYHGRTLRAKPGQQMAITGTAAAVFAIDWDADGDHDLLVGDIAGDVWRVRNEGSAGEWKFARAEPLMVGDAQLHVAGDAGPHCADWDGDGDFDLLVGDGEGAVSLFRNDGAKGAPKLAPAVLLVGPGNPGWGDDAPSEPTRGARAKVCTADWNGDGQLDLLVGDYGNVKPKPLPVTPEQAARHAERRAELEKLEAEFAPIAYNPPAVDESETARVAREKRIVELQTKMQQLRAELPKESESHGWVWLFLRAPQSAKGE